MPTPPSKRRTGLGRKLRKAFKGTDSVKIGSGNGTAKSASMADVMKKVDGIRYLVKGWIPFAMLTMLLAPPGVGKSAFALYGWVASALFFAAGMLQDERSPGPGQSLGIADVFMSIGAMLVWLVLSLSGAAFLLEI